MLEEALADFDGSVLVVTHDRYFLDRICDQVVAFEEPGVFIQPGNYSYYLEKKKERDALRGPAAKARESSSEAEKETSPAKSGRPRRLSFNEQREIEGMESAILKAEARVAELETTLNDPQFHATRSREARGLLTQLEEAKANVERLYHRWHELDQLKR